MIKSNKHVYYKETRERDERGMLKALTTENKLENMR